MAFLPALAYIDPGSGYIMLQVILAAIISSTVFFRNAIKSVLTKIFGSKAATDTDPDSSASETSSTGDQENKDT
jgi:hypothetical protein